MLKQHTHTPTEVGTFYNRTTDVYVQALGGNIHLGYWNDAADHSSIETATDRLTDLVAERLAPAEGHHILDIGCGHGSPALHIAARHAVDITGISISDYQVDTANSRPQAPNASGRVTFRLADAMKLPFEDESFDGAYAIESFIHMKDRKTAMAHVARALRPGARLVMADIYLEGELDGAAAEVMAETYDFFKLSLTPDCYQELAREAGLKIVDFTDISENARRSYDVLAATWRAAAQDQNEETAAEWRMAADLTERFGQIPEVRYGLLTAVRP
ncbi:SAM-dependent methyltransferase [Streptomyces sp. NPDC012825]|uniref:SAM-dependent methyltransferase n=1 Tax=Streptomyces sp. NPDC012825 TaxID=3364851 RepID=UPI0036A16EE1